MRKADGKMSEKTGPKSHSAAHHQTHRGFTGRELDIMSVLWDRGSGTVAEVRETMGSKVGYTTVLKLLQILEEKGAVRHVKEGRAYRYLPVIEQDQAGGHAVRRVVNKIFHGSAELLLAALVDNRTFTKEELQRMRKILDDAEKDTSSGKGRGTS